jgi:multimeric flavodoxin WrbA
VYVVKVTVFLGSPHKGGATYRASRLLLDKLESYGDVEGEIVALSDYDIGVCRGCKTCFAKGEERCPLKDDRDALIEKIEASDGVVFAAPNYSFQVAATMKIFLDRLGFLFHRPRFHGKTYTSISCFGIYGGKKITDYLDFCGGGLGFNVVKGSAIRTLEPMTEKSLAKMDRALEKQARSFHARMLGPALPVPSFIQLMVFRAGRSGMKANLDESSRDFTYYRDSGWFESDYFYPTHLGPLKRVAGSAFDALGARM